MIRAIIAASLRHRVTVVALAVVAVLAAPAALPDVPLDVFPEFAPPRVEIQTEAPGLSTDEVESLVTIPIENALVGTSWVTQIQSKSVLGLSSVVLFFPHDLDVIRARQLPLGIPNAPHAAPRSHPVRHPRPAPERPGVPGRRRHVARGLRVHLEGRVRRDQSAAAARPVLFTPNIFGDVQAPLPLPGGFMVSGDVSLRYVFGDDVSELGWGFGVSRRIKDGYAGLHYLKQAPTNGTSTLGGDWDRATDGLHAITCAGTRCVWT